MDTLIFQLTGIPGTVVAGMLGAFSEIKFFYEQYSVIQQLCVEEAFSTKHR